MPEIIGFGARLQDAICAPLRSLSKSMTFTSRSCTEYRWPPMQSARGRSRSSLKTTMPASWPTAIRLDVRCAVMIQKRSFSRRKVWIPVLFVVSQTRMVLSSELERISSFLGWKIAQETLLKWPRRVSTSHAFESFILQSLMRRSSAPDTTRGIVGWKAAQLTPRSCPSSTYFTTASEVPKTSAAPWGPEGGPPLIPPPMPMPLMPPAPPVFVRSPEVSHTRTVWSSDADTTRSSFGWKWADMT
mmetsp:Transcript_42595/g.110038  ORF Transcript_42595/g.110038 Transcript_42595/m.110038 type:complete len:244 (+) Transcript_42595:2896-3627(+)